MIMKGRKTKTGYIDDGHTVYDMSGLTPEGGRTDKHKRAKLSGKERSAAVKAAYAVYGPVLLLLLAAFTASMLLIRFWLG